MAEPQCLEAAGSPLGFDYRILRSSKRHSIAIEVRKAEVLVRAPTGVAEAYILMFLRQKSAWVKRKLAEQRALIASLIPAFEYQQGAQLAFMDEDLSLVIGVGKSAAVARVGQYLHLMLSARSRKPRQEQIRALLARWYQQQALHLLDDKTRVLAAALGARVTAVTVKATRSKWGHCTRAGAIQYNWQILLAPEAVVDYLVAHEVSHLRHHNHSPAFWALVASVCPDYLALRRWLKSNGCRLVL